jgi:fatty-acyl-CoA synthase
MGGISLAGMLGLEPGETIYAPLPLYHGESLFVGFAPAFRVGGTFASRRSFSASAFLDDVRRHRAVAFVYVGELCRYLLRQPPTAHDRDHLLRVAAGAGLRPDIWTAFQERFGIARIVEMYGATEGNVALQNVDGRVGSVGKPHPMLEDQVELACIDLAHGALIRGADGFCLPCPPDEPGELLGRVGVTGAMEYDGYTDREATERKLVRDAFATGDAWFRSGDLLRRDAEGYYYFVDRLGDTFRWKSENVATMEVAGILNGAPGVADTNVYGVEVPGEDGRAGMAAVVPLAEGSFDPAAFYAHAEQHLPAYARPAFVRLVSEMDVTGTLKQRKHALAAEGYDPGRVRDPLYVRDDAARTYVPLTSALLADITSRRLRL